MKTLKHDLKTANEALANILLRMAYQAQTEDDWERIEYRIAGMNEETRDIRFQVAEELRALRARLKAGEQVLDELDRKLCRDGLIK